MFPSCSSRTNSGTQCSSLIAMTETFSEGDRQMATNLKVVEADNQLNSSDRQKALDAALAQIDRAFGKGSAMKLGSKQAMEVEAISTGSLGLDIASGYRGIAQRPRDRNLWPGKFGQDHAWLCMPLPRHKEWWELQPLSMRSMRWIRFMQRRLGVISMNLIVSQPDTGEQALEITDTLVRSNAIDILVVDSVAALVPRAEIEGEMGDTHVGLQARLMSQALRKLTGSISRSKCMVIFINQVRMKIGVMYGNPETTSGGNALKFYASVRLGYPPDRSDQGARRSGG